VTEAIKSLYFGEVSRLGFDAETVTEAAQRILHTREQRTVPPLAVILAACREVRSERIQENDEARAMSYLEARDLAERRLRLINQRAWKKIPITEENIDLHIRQMEREEMIRVVG